MLLISTDATDIDVSGARGPATLDSSARDVRYQLPVVDAVKAEELVVVVVAVFVRESFRKVAPGRGHRRETDDGGGVVERGGGEGRVVGCSESGAQVPANGAAVIEGLRGRGGVGDVGRCDGCVDGGGDGQVAGFAGRDEDCGFRRA